MIFLNVNCAFRVDDIVREEDRDGVPYALIKWQHLNENFNRWIRKSQLSLDSET
jgi:hypothetical protein